MTQFEDFNHVNADATDKTKIVTTKFVLGFCHGQLRFCLLVRIGPYTKLEQDGVTVLWWISYVLRRHGYEMFWARTTTSLRTEQISCNACQISVLFKWVVPSARLPKCMHEFKEDFHHRHLVDFPLREIVPYGIFNCIIRMKIRLNVKMYNCIPTE